MNTYCLLFFKLYEPNLTLTVEINCSLLLLLCISVQSKSVARTPESNGLYKGHAYSITNVIRVRQYMIVSSIWCRLYWFERQGGQK